MTPLLLLLVLTLSACAGGGEAGGTDEASPTTDRRPSAAGPVPIAPPTSRAGNTTSTTTTTVPQPSCPSGATSEGDTVAIAVTEFRFTPACVEMTAAQGVDITNRGTVVHNTTLVVVGQEDVEFLGGDLQPGENTVTEAFGNQGPGANTYRLFCKYHQDQGMAATLIVR